MRRVAIVQGRPIVALATLLSGWVVMRVAVLAASAEAPTQTATTLPPQAQTSAPVGRPSPDSMAAIPAVAQTGDWHRLMPAPLAASPAPSPPLSAPPAPPRADPVPAAVSAGHLSLWMAAFAQLPSRDGRLVVPPAAGMTGASQAFVPTLTGTAAPKRVSRWSGDGWLLWRGEGGALSAAQAGAAYGASQAGAVLRYRLAPGSAHRPTAYLRLSTALGVREHELATGLALRPLARVPLSLGAELRVFDGPSGRRLRPAAIAISELPRITLPGGFALEAYGQTGWVGGRERTAFVDGQGRIDRPVARIGCSELRLGAAVWGGAQKGAARLDVGPSASLGLPFSREASARLALDWRQRIAGEARPASGPALTLSAGF